MDLLQLRYFIAVAETEHVTHAAESLNVAQPALTKTIKKLETEIGFPLFERKGRGITLSKCGQIFVRLRRRSGESYRAHAGGGCTFCVGY